MTTPHDWDDELDPDEALPESPDDQILSLIEEGDTGQVALTPDGSIVTLTGLSAGSVASSQATDESSGAITRLASRDEILDGKKPLFLLHRAYQKGTLLPHVLGSIVASTGGAVGLGAVAPLPRATKESNKAWLGTCATAAVKIADPAGFRLDTGFLPGPPPSARSKRWWPYLDKDPLDVGEVIDAQRSVDANLLLSPGRGIDPGNPQPSLDLAFDEADAALALLEKGERLALNLTVSRSWLTAPALRDQLLDRLLDQEQFDVWYIRVQWAGGLRSREQPLDLALLQGYKRLAQLASDEERTLLLPQTGLTGWLQLGFGAAGFGAGMPGADHAYKEPIGGGGGAAPIERYFEPSLLHAVERSVHDALRRAPGYIPCACPYCPALHASSDWRPDFAALHHLHWLGRLAADTAPTSRGGAAGAVRRTVRDALSAAATQPLAGLSEPKHLSVWDRLL